MDEDQPNEPDDEMQIDDINEAEIANPEEEEEEITEEELKRRAVDTHNADSKVWLVKVTLTLKIN